MTLLTLAAILCPSFTCEPPQQPCCKPCQSEQDSGLPIGFGAGLFALPSMSPLTNEPYEPWRPPYEIPTEPVDEPGAEVVPEPSAVLVWAVLVGFGAVLRGRLK